jgi:hypothetical protein
LGAAVAFAASTTGAGRPFVAGDFVSGSSTGGGSGAGRVDAVGESTGRGAGVGSVDGGGVSAGAGSFGPSTCLDFVSAIGGGASAGACSGAFGVASTGDEPVKKIGSDAVFGAAAAFTGSDFATS